MQVNKTCIKNLKTKLDEEPWLSHKFYLLQLQRTKFNNFLSAFCSHGEEQY